MVTIAQAAEANETIAAGSRPTGVALTGLMKKLLARDAKTHGPLPRDNPNFAVFAAPAQDAAVLSVGDFVRVDGTLASSTGSKGRQ